MESGSNRIVIRRKQPAFSKEQRVGFSLVIGVGFLAFVMGGFYLSAHLTSALEIEYDGPPILTQEQQQSQALAELQTADTDGDTFSDYEELYLYRTSPYLSDTDGDGTSDAEEVASGTDPNCAPGDACASIQESEFGVPANVVPGLPAPDTSALDNLDLVNTLTVGVDPAEIRQFLIEGGVDPNVVNELSDVELTRVYEETILQLSETGELEQLLQTQ